MLHMAATLKRKALRLKETCRKVVPRPRAQLASCNTEKIELM